MDAAEFIKIERIIRKRTENSITSRYSLLPKDRLYWAIGGFISGFFVVAVALYGISWKGAQDALQTSVARAAATNILIYAEQAKGHLTEINQDVEQAKARLAELNKVYNDRLTTLERVQKATYTHEREMALALQAMYSFYGTKPLTNDVLFREHSNFASAAKDFYYPRSYPPSE